MNMNKLNSKQNEWFLKYYKNKMDEECEQAWIKEYGYPEDYDYTKDHPDEYWHRCAFFITGWNNSKSQIIKNNEKKKKFNEVKKIDINFTTNGEHVWKQQGMTGSEHDECVLCRAITEGIGITKEQSIKSGAYEPCKYEVYVRQYTEDGPMFYRSTLRR